MIRGTGRREDGAPVPPPATSPLTTEMQIKRTLAIIRQLGEGKSLLLRSGHRVIMGHDLSIGFGIPTASGDWGVSRLSEMNFRELNELLNREEISFPVPDLR
jgi:hypothetical protein